MNEHAEIWEAIVDLQIAVRDLRKRIEQRFPAVAEPVCPNCNYALALPYAECPQCGRKLA